MRKKFHHSRPTFALWLAVEKTWRPFDPALPCSKPHTHTHTHTHTHCVIKLVLGNVIFASCVYTTYVQTAVFPMPSPLFCTILEGASNKTAIPQSGIVIIIHTRVITHSYFDASLYSNKHSRLLAQILISTFLLVCSFLQMSVENNRQ